MTEEEQLAYVLALSASENPILAAADLQDNAATAAAAAAAAPSGDSAAAAAAIAAGAEALAVANAAGLFVDRDKHPDEVAAALVAAQAEALMRGGSSGGGGGGGGGGGRRTTRSQTGSLPHQVHQVDQGLTEEEMLMIATALSNQD